MSLASSKIKLENDIKAALSKHNDTINNPNVKIGTADNTLASDLTTAIYEFLTEASVVVNPGIIVSTPSGPGSTVNIGTGILQ